MKKIRNILLVNLTILMMYPFCLHAQTDDLAEMSLEDLMNIKVSTVSKKAQSISEAPAIITVITAEQIEELGVQGISELMTFVPGFTVADSYWKRQIVTSRGVKMTLYNDKILMLVNGIPAYGAAAMEHFLDLVPITSIKQIEIIRGPGSTLYGTNAFAAVINIITKEGKTNNIGQAYIKGGSFKTREAGASFGDQSGDFSYHFGVLMKNNDGFVKTAIDEAGVEADIAYENDINAFYTDLAYKNVSINAGYYSQRYGKFGPIPAFYSGNRQHVDGGQGIIEKYYINGIFDKQLSEKFNTKISLHYDNVDKQHGTGDFGYNVYYNELGLIDTTVAPDYYRFGGYLMQGEAQLGYTISDKLSFIGGISVENRTTQNLADLYSDYNGDLLFAGSTEKMPFSVLDYGIYLQADGSFGKLGYVAGIRATYLGISEKMYFTPRVGLVYNFSKSSSVKLLYGEAFRGAGPQEQYYKVPQIIYGPDVFGEGLEPERIKTYELAWDQTLMEKYKIRVNGFYLNVFDIIGRRPATQQN
jgi:iron complex outermembrane receptor protein